MNYRYPGSEEYFATQINRTCQRKVHVSANFCKLLTAPPYCEARETDLARIWSRFSSLRRVPGTLRLERASEGYA